MRVSGRGGVGGLPGKLFARVTAALRRPLRGRPLPATNEAEVQLCLAVMEASVNAMFVTDRRGRILWINAAFTRLSGYGATAVLGKTPGILKSGRQPTAFYAELWRTILAGKAWRGRLVNRKRTGEIYDVEQTISPVFGADGRVSHFLAVHEDIFQRLQSERRLLHDAMFDPLTDLPNWNLLRRRIVEAIARAKRGGRFLAVISVGVHRPGAGTGAPASESESEANVEPGAVPLLLGAVRQVDLVARRGDGFVVVIEELERPELATLPAQRILDAFREPLAVGEDRHKVGAHAGIAVYPGDYDSPEILLQHAELARREARGRGTFQLFHPTI